MAKTLYRVYEVSLNAASDGVDSQERLLYMGETEASSARKAVGDVVSEPRQSTPYVAIPARNITTVRPVFKPATVSWS